MIRQHATRLASRCLNARIHASSELNLASSGTAFEALTKETGLPSSVSTWLLDSLKLQRSHFSTSIIGRSSEGQRGPADGNGAGPSEAAGATEQASASHSNEGDAAMEEDPYAGMTPDQMHEALKDKDEAIAHSTAQAEELTDMLKRTLADMENLRHRTSRQAEQSQKFAIQGFLKSLLDVGDNLERAYGAVPPEALQGKDKDGGSLSTEKALSLLGGLVDGLKMTEKIFDQALKQHGVEKYRPEGDKFDPNLHEALFEMPDPSKQPGTVGAVTKTGYTLHGRVVRPAQVGVVRAA